MTQKLKIRNVSEGHSWVRDGGTLWTLMCLKTTTPPTANIEASGRHRLHVVSGISYTLRAVCPAVKATSGMPPLRRHISSVAFCLPGTCAILSRASTVGAADKKIVRLCKLNTTHTRGT
ncbi:hypothetical protein E2C01_031637 [Portunus trituberculatus]|uniref:Uncharacterized protein n=1 Tax=Portunus trituberculatus TaxID=210409 RepID=A0A5B7EZ43_PORTR|nr:hypothetical protein [Portunus trituberculatus]